MPPFLLFIDCRFHWIDLAGLCLMHQSMMIDAGGNSFALLGGKHEDEN